MKLPPVRNLKKFLWFMEERQRVYLRRQAGEPYPWTSDPILRRFRFCNVYREQDRVTTFWRERWAKKYADHSNLWFAACLFRHINWPNTLEEIGFPKEWNPRKVLRILEKRKARGDKVYTSAYLLGGGNTKHETKVRYTVMTVLNPVWKWVEKALPGTGRIAPWLTDGTDDVPCTLREMFDWLCQFHGFGKFLSYEIVTDLRHTRYLCNAPDIMTWANLGPGAQRGLNRLYERELNQSHPQAQLLEELLAIQEWVVKNRDSRVLPTIEPRDLEHSFCECDKLLRAKERLVQGRIIGLERFRHPGLI